MILAPLPPPLSGVGNVAFAQNDDGPGNGEGGGRDRGNSDGDRGRSDTGNSGASGDRGNSGDRGSRESGDRGSSGDDGSRGSADRGGSRDNGSSGSADRGNSGDRGSSDKGSSGSADRGNSGDRGSSDKGSSGSGDRANSGRGNGSRNDRNGPSEESRGKGVRSSGPNRYNDLINSLGSAGRPAAISTGNADRERGFSRRLGDVAAELDDAATDALLSSGWQAPAGREGSFPSQAERVSTLVGIARELGLDPSVGAMQANFGTPQENRLIGPLDELQRLEASGRGSSPEAEALRGEIRQKAAGANPGGGPTVEGWEVIDLDVDGNGVVDARDLERARQRE